MCPNIDNIGDTYTPHETTTVYSILNKLPNGLEGLSIHSATN